MNNGASMIGGNSVDVEKTRMRGRKQSEGDLDHLMLIKIFLYSPTYLFNIRKINMK